MTNDFDKVIGWKESIIQLKSFKSKQKYKEYTFDTVDFLGKLEPEETGTITFTECTFKNVSFIGTTLKNIRFQKCKFLKTTFSLSTFYNCEFRNCKYEDIGISGNTTTFDNCYIDSEKLLKNTFLNQDKILLKKYNTTPLYQKFKHFESKSTLSRKIMSMSPIVNDLPMLIKSISVARNYEANASIYKNIYYFTKEPVIKKILYISYLLLAILEKIVINAFGLATGWGYRIGRSTFLGISGIIIFSLIYKYFIFKELSYIEVLLRSFEYWFLIGYTKYTFDCLDIYDQLIIFTNAFIGLFWFASLIPVIFNKMSNHEK